MDFVYPTNENEIDPDTARFLYEHHCAILVIEDLPVGSQFGIDLSVFQVGEKFKGVKLIPPGIHFVFASSIGRNSHDQFGPRCGFYHDFRLKELLVKRWSAENEDFDDSLKQDDEYNLKYSENLKDLDRYLGAYCYSTYSTFRDLTNKMYPELVNSLTPVCNKITSVPQLARSSGDACEFQQTSRTRRTLVAESNRTLERNLLPDLKQPEATLIKFTKIPRDHLEDTQNIPTDLITRYHLDTTMKFEHVFVGDGGRERMLGEFQFAFTTLLLGHVYECFEKWRELLDLVCLADLAIDKYSQFFCEFAAILQKQLKQVSEDLFENIDDSNNLIRSRIETLIRNAYQSSSRDRMLMERLEDLKCLGEGNFGWKFNLNNHTDDDDDEQPVVVEV